MKIRSSIDLDELNNISKIQKIKKIAKKWLKFAYFGPFFGHNFFRSAYFCTFSLKSYQKLPIFRFQVWTKVFLQLKGK